MNDENQSLPEQTLATIDKIALPIFSSIIMPFLTTNPMFQASILGAYGMFGVYMQYNQNKVNNFIKILQENPGIFTKKIVETEEFKDGFLIVCESYLKGRNEEKIEGIKNILLNFSILSEEDKKNLELEKMLNTLKLLNENDINLLSLYNLKKKSSASPIKILYGKLINGVPLSQNDLKILLNTEFTQKYNGFSKNDMLELINGLVNLNLILDVVGGTWDDNGDGLFIITKYGKEFIKFIKNYES